jgi:hypothetical protein
MLDNFYVRIFFNWSNFWSLSFTDWILNQEESLYMLYIDKILMLMDDNDKSVQKSALSNFSLLLQNKQSSAKFAKRLSTIADVRTLLN